MSEIKGKISDCTGKAKKKKKTSSALKLLCDEAKYKNCKTLHTL